jgi:hypothetical protein
MNNHLPDTQAAYAPGYPKIPNVPHERQEIDTDAVLDFMPIGEPITEPTLRAQKLFKGLRGDEQLQWTVSFTLPALFARVRNLEAQVLAGWELAAHWQRECEAMKEQENVRFTSDRRANTDYRMRISETGQMEDRNCFGLPTVVTIQVSVPKTTMNWGDHEDAVYEGRYALMHNHRGSRAMTMAATSEDAIKAIAGHLPGPYTEQEDPSLIAQDAIYVLKNRKLLLQERAQFEKDAQAIETLIVNIQGFVTGAAKGTAVKTNLFKAQAHLNSLLDRFIELRGEDPATIDRGV